MAQTFEELVNSAPFATADPSNQVKQRDEWLAKTQSAYKDKPAIFDAIKNKVMAREMPANQYGVSEPEQPWDINTGIKEDTPMGQQIMANQDIAPIPAPTGKVTKQDPNAFNATPLHEISWNALEKSDFYTRLKTNDKINVANEWLAQQKSWNTRNVYNKIESHVRPLIPAAEDEPLPTPGSQEVGAAQKAGMVASLGLYNPYGKAGKEPALGDKLAYFATLGMYDPYNQQQKATPYRVPLSSAEVQATNTNKFGQSIGEPPPAATPEEIKLAELKLNPEEKTAGLKEPKVRTLMDVDALHNPGFVGSMLNPFEALAMGGAGFWVAKRFGKPVLATTLDYAMQGMPSTIKGIKGFIGGFTNGYKAISKIAKNRNVPASDLTNLMETPWINNWKTAATRKAIQEGVEPGSTFVENVPKHIDDTIQALKKYAADNNFTDDELNVLLKTGDIPPTNPLYELRMLPGPSRNAPFQGTLPLREAGEAYQLQLPLKTKPPTAGEPVVAAGKTIQVPPAPGMESGIPGDTLPPVGNMNERMAAGRNILMDWIREGQSFIETPIRMFQKAGGKLKELVYDKIDQADIDSLREFYDRFTPKIMDWKKNADPKRLATFMISKQDDGMEILKGMGINVDKELAKMTPNELAIAKQMREFYEEMFHRINIARIKSGLPEIGKVKDYFTFYRQMNWLDEKMGFNVLSRENPIDDITKKFIHPNSTFFASALKRLKGSKIPVELDAFATFGRYMQNALNHIYMSPEISQGRKIVGQIAESHPELHGDITNWLDFIAGKNDAIIPGVTKRIMTMLTRNVAASAISWNVRTMGVQGTVWRNTVAEIGIKDAVAGVMDLVSPAARKFSRENSNLIGRKFDVAVDSILALSKGPMKSLLKKGMRGMQEIDFLTAEASFNAFMRHGKKLGMTGKELLRYANDAVVKTQASGRKVHLSRVQRSDLGRLASTLQTFVIGDWSFLTQDVLGLGRNVPFTRKNLGKIYRYVGMTMLFNSLFEDVLGTTSPFPTPIRRTVEELNKKDPNYLKAVAAGGQEMLDMVPVIGSAARWGTGFFGPGAGTAGKALLRTSQGRLTDALSEATKLTGIPAQFINIPLRLSKGYSGMESVIGRTQEDKKKPESRMKPIGSAPASIGGKKKTDKKQSRFTEIR